MCHKRAWFLLLPLFLFICFVSIFPVSAQDLSLGIAQYYSITDENVKGGHIISADQDGYHLSNDQYDVGIIGVVSDNPAISLKPRESEENQHPVIAVGKSYVIVNGTGGPIELGDLITSSDTPGVGVKASKRGFVIGSALGSFNPENPTDEGKVLVSLDLHFSMLGLGDRFGEEGGGGLSLKDRMAEIYSLSAIAAYEEPSKVFKYVLAGFVVLVSILFSFFTFGRTAKNGIEAFGRNPLAGKLIGIGMVLNVSIAVVIVLSGVGVAYLILIM
ncbi:MAG: hypothetical protein ACOX6V_04440 [Patescibacteria group bacterium]|jgi:F0F1-type ATP synthase membrane subunit c/vacuolar-type H+-ATPase subunit K